MENNNVIMNKDEFFNKIKGQKVTFIKLGRNEKEYNIF